jgi:hypothetical protein
MDNLDLGKLLDGTVMLSVKFGILGNRRKVSTANIEADADKELLSVSKKLLDSPEYDLIIKQIGQARKWLNGWALPTTILRGGMHLVARGNYERIREGLETWKERIATAVARFCEIYEVRATEARARLRSLASEDEYPSVEKVRQAFGVQVQAFSLAAPAGLDAEERQRRQELASAWEEIQLGLRETFRGLVEHLAERLQPEPDGTRKRLVADATIRKFKEFFESFDANNLTGDAALAGLVAECRGLLAGRSKDSFRRESFRDYARQQLTEMKARLDTLVERAPSRPVVLEDDGVAA